MSATPPPPSATPSLVAESLHDDETNTLILTGLSTTFFGLDVLDALKDHFASFGEIHSWAPLKGFLRIIIVYWTVEDASRAKEECDGMVLADEDDKVISQPLRLYRGENTELFHQTERLPVPHATHNFLISPPGSPPVGWEQAAEEPPNTEALAADLISALKRLQVTRDRPMQNGIQLIMTPDDVDEDEEMEMDDRPAGSRPGLTVFLEDADFNPDGPQDGGETPVEGDGVFEGEMMRGGITRVKTTVASFHLDSVSNPPSGFAPGVSTGTGRIARVPTPRPPVSTE